MTLPNSTKQQPEAPEASPPEASPRAQEPSPPQSSEQPASTPNRSRAAMRKQSFGDPEADPWGSPDLHRGHNHSSYTTVPPQTNGTNAPTPARTTSQFTTQSNSASSSHHQNVQPSSLSSEGGWGGYNGASSQPYATPGLGEGGFGPPPSGGGGGNSNPPPELGRSIGRINPSGTGSEEIITITALSEKEGMFMFQHRNYEVASSRRTTKVTRRYSDFVWLLDCLHKRYPFRQLPLLPPKRVASKLP